MPNRKSHRGRFQAQGGGTEKSVSWSLAKPSTKSHADNALINLKSKMSPTELTLREECLKKAFDFVHRAPSNGLMAVIKKPFTPFPPKRDIRIDIEILSGTAFIDD